MTEYYPRDIADAVRTALVIEAGRSCIALELKSAARWQERDLADLNAFLKATPHCKAAILCHNGEDAVRIGERLWALPTSLVLS
ncbi:MAG: hypothetical protein R6X10_02195 [Desulfobacterales bacterium]